MGKVTQYKLTDRWKTAFPSELEFREAARFAEMSWAEFEALPGTPEVMRQLDLTNNKCAVIAHYRMTRLFDAVMSDLRQKFPEKR